MKAHTSSLPLLLALSLFMALPWRSDGQVLYGSLTGNVTDSSTAAVPAAKVEALNTSTGIFRHSETDERGVYTFNDLQPGAYKVTITTGAFAPFVREGIPVEAALVRRLDARLDVSQVKESLTIVAAPTVSLQTDRGEVNAQLEREEVADLPVDSGRNFQSLLKLVPGIEPPAELQSGAVNPQRAMATNVNGAAYTSNNTRIDGATVSYPWLPWLIAYVPPVEAIETVNVITNSFDAEQGMAGAASTHVTIKSGTNAFHGSVWEYTTNSALKARNYFYCLYTCTGNPNHPAKNIMNQPGATFGGPIKRNKLFFFASWEMTAVRQNVSALETIPTAKMKQGDFSEFSNTVYDPATGTPDGKGRTLFPNRIIPASRIDPAAAIMASLLPTTSMLPGSNYFASGDYKLTRNNTDFKVNYNPTSKASVFARYAFSPSNVYDPPALGAAGGDALGGGQPGNANGLVQTAATGGTYIVSPHMLVDGNAGFTRIRLLATNTDIKQNFGLDVLKIPGTNGPDPLQGGIPRFVLTGISDFGNANVSNPALFRDNQYTGVVNLSWMKGTHSIRIGGEYSYYTINHFEPQTAYGPRGGFNFTGGITSLNGGAASNGRNSWADFLLGLPNSMGKDLQYVNPSAVRMPTYGFYIRDQWQVNSRLTLNYGMRWEYIPFATRDHRGGERYDPQTDKVLIGGLGGVPTSTGVDTSGQFAPRLGVAWRITPKTVLRGGFGISLDPTSFRLLTQAYPAVISLQLTGATTYQAAGSLRTGIPPVIGPDLSKGIIDLPPNVGTTTFPQDFNRGYAKSYNVTLERELGWGFLAQAGYVGTRVTRQPAVININASDSAGTGQAGRLLNIKFGQTADILEQTPFAGAYYDSLQTRVLRRIKGGSFGLSYTFSKAINSVDNTDVSPSWNGPSMWGRNKALASFSRPQNLQVYFLQQLPFGVGKRLLHSGFVSRLAGGWQVNGIFGAMAGKPFTVTNSATSVNTIGNLQTADQVKPVVPVYGLVGKGESYFDPNSFMPVTGVRFGSSGRDILFGPGVMNLDGGIFRSFRIKEKIELQFRWMVFNVTNTPAFGQPGAVVSSASRNPDGTVLATNGWTEITSAAATERHMRFALKVTF
jgi:hypothetical protein